MSSKRVAFAVTGAGLLWSALAGATPAGTNLLPLRELVETCGEAVPRGSPPGWRPALDSCDRGWKEAERGIRSDAWGEASTAFEALAESAPAPPDRPRLARAALLTAVESRQPWRVARLTEWLANDPVCTRSVVPECQQLRLALFEHGIDAALTAFRPQAALGLCRAARPWSLPAGGRSVGLLKCALPAALWDAPLFKSLAEDAWRADDVPEETKLWFAYVAWSTDDATKGVLAAGADALYQRSKARAPTLAFYTAYFRWKLAGGGWILADSDVERTWLARAAQVRPAADPLRALLLLPADAPEAFDGVRIVELWDEMERITAPAVHQPDAAKIEAAARRLEQVAGRFMVTADGAKRSLAAFFWGWQLADLYARCGAPPRACDAINDSTLSPGEFLATVLASRGSSVEDRLSRLPPAFRVPISSWLVRLERSRSSRGCAGYASYMPLPQLGPRPILRRSDVQQLCAGK